MVSPLSKRGFVCLMFGGECGSPCRLFVCVYLFVYCTSAATPGAHWHDAFGASCLYLSITVSLLESAQLRTANALHLG